MKFVISIKIMWNFTKIKVKGRKILFFPFYKISQLKVRNPDF